MKRITPVLVLLLLLFTACTPQVADPSPAGADAVSAATRARYRENEILEYQGARLDPAIGPRDNSIKGIQEVDISSYTLSIKGLVETPVTLTYEEARALESYERLITLFCVEGWDATVLWKGVLIDELIGLAGARPRP